MLGRRSATKQYSKVGLGRRSATKQYPKVGLVLTFTGDISTELFDSITRLKGVKMPLGFPDVCDDGHCYLDFERHVSDIEKEQILQHARAHIQRLTPQGQKPVAEVGTF